MNAALLKRLKRLDAVQPIESLPWFEFQIGHLKELPAEYTGERHFVTVGRDPNGYYQWEERPGAEPDAEERSNVRSIRLFLASPEDVRPAPNSVGSE